MPEEGRVDRGGQRGVWNRVETCGTRGDLINNHQRERRPHAAWDILHIVQYKYDSLCYFYRMYIYIYCIYIYIHGMLHIYK